MKPDWFPDWSGQTTVILASGPSAASAGIDEVRGKARVIAVNNSWRLAPWADALYGCDFNWWSANSGVPDFAGMKISQDEKCKRAFRDVRIVLCDRGGRKTELILDRPGLLGWCGNGGFHGLNLAAQFGSRRLVMVGFDMRIDLGVHWHGKHPKGLNNPMPHSVQRWREAIDAVAPAFREAGITVINASEVSALKAYPKMPLKEAIA